MSVIEVAESMAALRAVRGEWDALAETPFVTAEWLLAWFEAFGDRPYLLLSRNPAGRLVAAAAFRRRRGRLGAAANVYTGDWDVVAGGDEERARLWNAAVAVAPPVVLVRALRDDRAAAARDALTQAGYRVRLDGDLESPTLRLPASYDELLASVSRGLRQQVGRHARTLHRAGRVELRTNCGDAGLEADLEAFLRVEASGWKGRAGSALQQDAAACTCFCAFARAAARAGWLRLRLLELDGVVVAADLSCAYASAEWLLKTGYDERRAALRPGFVLRAEALRAAIEEGSSRYEFLGGPDPYKLRWTTYTDRRVLLHAYRGVARPVMWAGRGGTRLRRVVARVGPRLRTP